MAQSFLAQLKNIRDMKVRDMRYVAAQSIQDVVEAAQTTQQGITQGATSFEEGKVPVGLTADLVDSLTSDGVQGADSYAVAIAGFEIGDVMHFEWTSDHAIPIEMGTSKIEGRHFVGANAKRFSEFVKDREAEVRK